MNFRASYVGELAARFLARRKPGLVTRVFRSSAYFRTGNDFGLVLNGRLRSPVTINVTGDTGSMSMFRVGDQCALSPAGIRLGSSEISMKGAVVHRSSLRKQMRVSLPPPLELVKGVAMLRSLYDVSKSGPSWAGDVALGNFVAGTLVPYSHAKSELLYDRTKYLPLIGRGGGFTPAGDDFVAGFLATYNFVARSRRSRAVSIPRSLVYPRTVPESAAIIVYAAQGYVDEGLERLILASLGERGSFYGELLEVARRGHTSGIDMSLGVLLCEATLSDLEGRSTLDGCIRALRNA